MVTSDALPSTGGVQNVVWQLSTAFAKEGHKVVALSPGQDGSSSWGSLTIERAQLAPFSVRAWLRDPGLLFRGIGRFSKFLSSHRAEVLHLHSVGAEAFYAALAARLRGIAVVATIHGFRDFGTLTWFGLLMERFTFLLCHVVTTCCEADRRGILSRHPMLASRIRTLPNGVDLAQIDALAGPNETGRVAFVGRLTKQKGLDILLQAWKIVENATSGCQLIVAGNGPEEESLKKLERELDLKAVKWLGQLGPDEAISALTTSCIVCIPSRWEGMPLVALEGMGAGRALVTSEVDGLPEVVVQGETGLMVAKEDPVALANALLALLTEPSRSAAFGAAGRRRVKEYFTWTRISELYLEAYRDAGGLK